MLRELEEPSDFDALRVRRPVQQLERRLQLVHPVVGELRAVARLDVVALEVELLVVRHRVAALLRRLHLEVGRRPLEVVAGESDLARAHFAQEAPVEHAVGVGRGLGAILDVGQRRARRRGVMHAVGVDKQELVLAVAVLEVPVDPLVLEQPGDEVVVALAVLHTVHPLAVGAEGLELELGDAVVLEDLLDDLGNGLILEDPAVGGAGQEPEPGLHRRLVGEVAAAMHARAEARDVAIEKALGVVALLHRHGHGLAEQVFRLQVGLGAQQMELGLAERAQARRRRHRREQQVGGGKRRREGDRRSHVVPSATDGDGRPNAWIHPTSGQATKVTRSARRLRLRASRRARTERHGHWPRLRALWASQRRTLFSSESRLLTGPLHAIATSFPAEVVTCTPASRRSPSS